VPIAASKASGRVASTKTARCVPSGPATPTPAPSSRPAAEEDDPTPRNSLAQMAWDQSLPTDPLPVIDFSVDTHSTKSSIHCPDNEMLDDSKVEVTVSSFRDPDAGALPLSPSTTPAPAAPESQKSEVAQLFDLIVAKMAPMEREIKHIAGIINSTTKGGRGPQQAPAGSPLSTLSLRAQPQPLPSLPTEGLAPTPPPTSHHLQPKWMMTM
jgi:hypothetical protein